MPISNTLLWLAFFLSTWLILTLIFSKPDPPKLRLVAVIFPLQLLLRLCSRYWLPLWTVRAGDENVWLDAVQMYETTGVIPYGSIAQGPGIFWAVGFIGQALHVEYGTALTILAVGLGSLCVVPVYLMYESFAGDRTQVALASVLLVFLADSMVYSTTIGRPTLLGLFLLPLAIWALQSLYAHFRWSTFTGLLLVTVMILMAHAPITYVVLLLALSLSLIVYDQVTKWQVAYAMIAFTLYGIVLQLILPDLDRIWKTELLGVYPLSVVPSVLGSNFFLAFPLIAASVLALSWIVAAASRRAGSFVSLSQLLRARTFYMVVLVALVLAALVVASLFQKYSGFIADAYGDPVKLLLLHGWKIPFGILALAGVRRWLLSRSDSRRVHNCVAFPWLLCIIAVVAFLAWYPPLKAYPGLWNLDERFFEFAYYPAFYFVGVELERLSTRLPRRTFNWVILPLVSLFVIPSIIVGTRDVDFIKPP